MENTDINKSKKNKNAGLIGFTFALLGLFLGWIPVIGFIIWLLGLIYSIIGLFKNPDGFAKAGLIISLIGIIWICVDIYFWSCWFNGFIK